MGLADFSQDFAAAASQKRKGKEKALEIFDSSFSQGFPLTCSVVLLPLVLLPHSLATFTDALHLTHTHTRACGQCTDVLPHVPLPTASLCQSNSLSPADSFDRCINSSSTNALSFFCFFLRLLCPRDCVHGTPARLLTLLATVPMIVIMMSDQRSHRTKPGANTSRWTTLRSST